MANSKISGLPLKTSLIDTDYLPLVDSSDVTTKRSTFRDIRKSLYTDFKFIQSKSDFPTAISGVIYLEDNVTYFITSDVDLTGDRLVAGRNTTIIGGSSENCFIRSTGLSASSPLISSAWSLPIRNIGITHALALNLNASGNANQAIDWFGVNFVNCATIGTVANYSNFIMTDSAFLNSSGMTFDGTIGTIGFTQCLFDGQALGTAIIIPSTATITRRLRIIYSSFVTLSGETSLNVSLTATIPTEGYILDTVNFSGGGTYISGVQFDNNKALFSNCRGIANTATVANYYMTNNAVATDVISSGVAVKAAGATTAGEFIKFSHSNNRATYIGALTQKFLVTSTMTLVSGNNNQIGIYVAKNGVIIDGPGTLHSTDQGRETLSSGDGEIRQDNFDTSNDNRVQ